MATSGIIAGTGTTFSLGGTLIGQVTSITLPDYEYEDVDLTELVDVAKKYASGQISGGTASVTVNYDDDGGGATDGAIALYTSFAAGVVETCIVLFGGAAADSLTFSGFITELGGEIPEGSGVITQTITIQVTGLPVYAGTA